MSKFLIFSLALGLIPFHAQDVSALEYESVTIEEASGHNRGGYRRPGRFYNNSRERDNNIKAQLRLRRQVKDNQKARYIEHESRNTALRAEDAPTKKLDHGGLSSASADRAAQKRWGNQRPGLRSNAAGRSFYTKKEVLDPENKDNNNANLNQIQTLIEGKKLQHKDVGLREAHKASNKYKRPGLGSYLRNKGSQNAPADNRDGQALRDAFQTRRALNGRGSLGAKSYGVDKSHTNKTRASAKSNRRSYRGFLIKLKSQKNGDYYRIKENRIGN